MELRAVNDTALTMAARQNLITTYMTMARATEGATISQEPGWVQSSSRERFAFAQFALGFEGDEQAAARLRMVLTHQPWKRLFHITGDTMPGLLDIFEGAGYRQLYQLVELASEEEPVEGTGRLRLAEDHEREWVADQMVDCFFNKQDRGFTSAVSESTLRCNCPLWLMENDGQPQCVAMTVVTPGTLGIYNVCVPQHLRRQGYGSQMVRALQRYAAQRGLLAVLQCDPRLAEWYQRMGFFFVGEVKSFAPF